jgi:hypothetical protein
MDNFAKEVINNGGVLKPLLILSKDMDFPSLTNPTILNYQDKLIVNIRNVNYSLYHSELNRYEHTWGPLVYIHPENDLKLKTVNYLCELTSDLNINSYSKIDTSKCDDPNPKWEFHGLEDVRLVVWDDTLYAIGVRRDTTDNGQGRMELSKIIIEEGRAKEVSRLRIPGPLPDEEYCMKNCTPVLDHPYRLLKWTNPTAFMDFDPDGNKDTTLFETGAYKKMPMDFRGGGQVIPYKDGYITIVHETYLFNSETGKKNATYRHMFVMWDKDFKQIKFSKKFSFLNMRIEFSCGMCEYKGDYIVTFSACDNTAYILKIPGTYLEQFLSGG